MPEFPVSIDPSTSPHCRASWLPYLESYANNDPIDSLTDRSGHGMTISATTTGRPTFITNQINGKAIARFDGTANYLQAALAADWKFLHDGHNVMAIAVLRQAGVNPNDVDPIIDTNGTAATSTGIAWFLDDRSGSSRSNAIASNCTKSSAGVLVLNGLAQDVLNPLAYQILTLEHTTSRYSIEDANVAGFDAIYRVDGLAVGGARAANLPHGTGNPTNKLTVGALSTLATFFGQIDLAGLWLFDQVVGAALFNAYHRYIADLFGLGLWKHIGGYGHNSFPGCTQLSDKSLLVAYTKGYKHDTTFNVPIVCQKSTDMGRTWGIEREVVRSASLGTRDPSLFTTSSGTVICWFFTDDASVNIDVICLRSLRVDKIFPRPPIHFEHPYPIARYMRFI